MACPQICFCEYAYSLWLLSSGHLQTLCNAGAGLPRPLFPGTPALWLSVVSAKSGLRERREGLEGERRRGMAPDPRFLCYCLDQLHSALSKSSTSLDTHRSISNSWAMILSSQTTSHATLHPQLLSPQYGSPSGLLPPSEHQPFKAPLSQVRPPLPFHFHNPRDSSCYCNY